MSAANHDNGVEHRRKWSFHDSPGGGWVWEVEHPDGSRECSVPFATLGECTADARAHGYVVWKSEEERRRELRLKVADALKGNAET